MVPLDELDVDLEVKQLFIDVLRKDPLSRPGTLDLLNRPIISSAVDYGCYFDECYMYVNEDTEDQEASPTTESRNVSISEVPQILLTSSYGGRISLHSLGDEVGELPQIPHGNRQLKLIRGSQDSGVEVDMESSGSRVSMRSSSGSSNQHIKLLHQDSGLEDSLDAVAREHSQPGGK